MVLNWYLIGVFYGCDYSKTRGWVRPIGLKKDAMLDRVVSWVHLVGSVRSDTQTHLAGKRRVTKKRCSVESVWLAGASRGVMQVYHNNLVDRLFYVYDVL